MREAELGHLLRKRGLQGRFRLPTKGARTASEAVTNRRFVRGWLGTPKGAKSLRGAVWLLRSLNPKDVANRAGGRRQLFIPSAGLRPRAELLLGPEGG